MVFIVFMVMIEVNDTEYTKLYDCNTQIHEDMNCNCKWNDI